MNKHLLSVGETAHLIGMGRSKTYDLVLRGEIASIKIGRSRRVIAASIDRYIARRLAEQTGETSGQLSVSDD